MSGASFMALAAASSAGGNDAFTKLLLHGNGTNGSTVITDSSAAAHAMTAQGSAAISTAQSIFGGSSILFSGVGNSSFITSPDSADWDFGSGDFTIDFRFYLTSTAAGNWMGHRGASPDIAWVLGLTSTTNLAFYYTTDGSTFVTINVTVPTIATGVWYHFQIGRNGATTYPFFNGATASPSGNITGTLFNSSSTLRIGGDGINATGLQGYMQELRISKGICRNTAPFTPQAVPYF